jgi:hypothetical protein
MRKISLLALALGGVMYAGEMNYEEISTQSIFKLASSLQAELGKMMKSDPSGLKGLHYCAYTAQDLTKEINQGFEENVTVRRTALKVRNLLNTPTNQDLEVMKEFKNQIEKEKQDPVAMAKVIETNEAYFMYKPLTIGEVCLKCHGDIDKMDKSLVEELAKQYPNDKATGYKLGDFRGVLVSIIAK